MRKTQTRRLKRRTRKTKNLSKIRGGASFSLNSLRGALGKGVGFNAKNRASKKTMNFKKYGKNVHTRRLTASELRQMNKANEVNEANKSNKTNKANKETNESNMVHD
jgi:hypothetical protein